ncbi:MAG: hypothetical protein J3R72DRAFT_428851 [Linnemannia gamsii]|nr:MAG: hypothetical protein J3R72DRAFT_428851 [Linnemannia gamsii]
MRLYLIFISVAVLCCQIVSADEVPFGCYWAGDTPNCTSECPEDHTLIETRACVGERCCEDSVKSLCCKNQW